VPLASVYPLVTARALARPFTYEVPDDVVRGAVVQVRFGNARRRGVVTQVGVDAPAGVDPAPVERVLAELPPPLVELALWLADYYGSTPGRGRRRLPPPPPGHGRGGGSGGRRRAARRSRGRRSRPS